MHIRVQPALLALATTVTAIGLSPTPAFATESPSRFEVLAAIARASNTLLVRGEACDDVIGEPVRRPTLGDWIAYNLSLFEGPSDIVVECEPDGRRAGRFSCEVTFRTDQGGESPWAWGVRASVERRAGRVRLVGPFMCTGAG
jgi:hypothetical protein